MVDAVKQKLDWFRSGHSAVRETGHTVLIGWSDRSAAFIEQVGVMQL